MTKHDLYHTIRIEDVLTRLKTLSAAELRHGTLESAILGFEQRQQIVLPPDYRAFLQMTNGASILDDEFYALNELASHTFKFYDRADREHAYQVLPFANENGNPLFLNLRQPKGAQDPARRDIMDMSHEDGQVTVVAKSFGEFLHRFLESGGASESGMYWLDPEFRPPREYFGETYLEGPTFTIPYSHST